MSRGIFITGTDTGVGKTIVAAMLARLLRMRGLSCRGDEAGNQRLPRRERQSGFG